MTNPDLTRTRDAVPNQRQVVAGLTSELRRSVNAEAQTGPCSRISIAWPAPSPACRAAIGSSRRRQVVQNLTSR